MAMKPVSSAPFGRDLELAVIDRELDTLVPAYAVTIQWWRKALSRGPLPPRQPAALSG